MTDGARRRGCLLARRPRAVDRSADKAALANRQRRQMEIPPEAGEAFDLPDAAIRELPRPSRRWKAPVTACRYAPRWGRPTSMSTVPAADGTRCRVFGYRATRSSPRSRRGHDRGSVMLICEPETPAWSDWFRVDDGTNLENAEAITRGDQPPRRRTSPQ